MNTNASFLQIPPLRMLEKSSKKARKKLEKSSGIFLKNFALYARDCSFPCFWLFPFFCLFNSSINARKRSKTLGRRLETCSPPHARTLARKMLEKCSFTDHSLLDSNQMLVKCSSNARPPTNFCSKNARGISDNEHFSSNLRGF